MIACVIHAATYGNLLDYFPSRSVVYAIAFCKFFTWESSRVVPRSWYRNESAISQSEPFNQPLELKVIILRRKNNVKETRFIRCPSLMFCIDFLINYQAGITNFIFSQRDPRVLSTRFSFFTTSLFAASNPSLHNILNVKVSVENSSRSTRLLCSLHVRESFSITLYNNSFIANSARCTRVEPFNICDVCNVIMF